MIRSSYPRTRRAKKGNHSKRIYKESVLSKVNKKTKLQVDAHTIERFLPPIMIAIQKKVSFLR